MSKITPDRLAEIRARVEKAVPAPWRVVDQNEGDLPEYGAFWTVCSPDAVDDGDWFAELRVGYRADADFIAHARTDIPALLSEVERLREENDGYKADIEAGRLMRLPATIGQLVYVPSGDGGIYTAYIRDIGVLRPETHDAIMLAIVRVGTENEVLEYLIAPENKGTRWFDTEAEARATLGEEKDDG